MTDLDSRFDVDHIDMAAVWASRQLRAHGVARVHLDPGDFTRYSLLVTAPGREWTAGDEPEGAQFWVAWLSRSGAGYQWSPGYVHPTWAAEHFTNGSAKAGERRCAAQVIARFLTTLTEHLQAPCEHSWVAENTVPEGVLLSCLDCPAEAIQHIDGTIIEVDTDGAP